MGRFVFALIFLGFAVAMLAVGHIEYHDDFNDNNPVHTVGLRRWALIPLGLFFLFLIWSTVRIIGPGDVGIPVTLGSAGKPIHQGMHLTWPIADVKRLSIRTQNYTMSKTDAEGSVKGNDEVLALGSDGAQVTVDATVLFHLNRSAASSVYRKVGIDYVAQVIRPEVRTDIRDAVAQFTAVEAATNAREKITGPVEERLRSSLTKRGLTLESFLIRRVQPADNVQHAIDEKVKAQQEAQQQEFVLQKTVQQAEVRRQDAKGLADSQTIINATLTPQYLQYLYVQKLGDMVNSPNHSTIILPFDQKLTPQLLLPNEVTGK